MGPGCSSCEAVSLRSAGSFPFADCVVLIAGKVIYHEVKHAVADKEIPSAAQETIYRISRLLDEHFG